jgi:hypothetical protein
MHIVLFAVLVAAVAGAVYYFTKKKAPVAAAPVVAPAPVEAPKPVVKPVEPTKPGTETP